MSHSLRNRFPSTTSKDQDPKESSSGDSTPLKAEEVRLTPTSKITPDSSPHPHKHKTRKRRNGFIFFLGGLFGILVAGFFAGQSDLVDFPDFGDLSMDSLMDVLPAGFIRDARDLAVCFPMMKRDGDAGKRN
jgi:phospholipid:diacylglycerol acyltransferase